MSNDELIARLEAATGWDDDLDLALAEYAWDNRIPMPPPYYDGGPINYDPRLWLERHDWRPTASIDAALTLVPEGWSWSVGDLRGYNPPMWRCHVRDHRPESLTPDGHSHIWREGNTRAGPALAICIAALRAGEG